MSSLTSPDICLRVERPEDTPAIREINRAAFGSDAEARLVDALRAANAVTLSAIAVLDANRLSSVESEQGTLGLLSGDDTVGGEVVGHVLFTPVVVTTEGGDTALLGLGPVAVLPSRQRQGIGTMLISGCLEYLRARGHRGVVVVGEPTFYRRFGFIEAGRWGLQSELQVPEENFMALALASGVLGGVSGTVRYRPEFAEI
jgi:putative acetyltransferase